MQCFINLHTPLVFGETIARVSNSYDPK